MKLTPLKIAKAKQTRFGRVLCRLLGDERGAVMMEYVMIAVLVAAAAVALFMVFGRSIRDKTNAMIETMDGDPDAAATKLETQRGERITDAGTAMTTGDKLGNKKGKQ